uniref:Uncharacterized protein n=2 Tax=Auxenochlorella protothecoides TaxID=3075 RepID=A0A1D2A198_AUXPR
MLSGTMNTAAAVHSRCGACGGSQALALVRGDSRRSRAFSCQGTPPNLTHQTMCGGGLTSASTTAHGRVSWVSGAASPQQTTLYTAGSSTSSTSSTSSSGSSSDSEEPTTSRAARRTAVKAMQPTVSVCQDKSCGRKGSAALLAAFEEAAQGACVQASKCQGYCKVGPSVRLHNRQGGYVQYAAVNTEDVEELLDELKQ